ncbi:MAG TPA: metallophosphoesterase [Gemmatales bacterium]|nr:metallophosphoesterase [Gemmatales bacterium]
MPDPVKLIATIKKAAQILRQQSGRIGKFVELTDCEDVLVVGDLHGHLANFRQVLQLAKLGEHPRRHVVVQELVHGPFRYTSETGGELSHRLVDVVSAYICQYPGRVHYLLGNHELAQWTHREIAKNNESLNNLFVLGVCTAYPEHTEEMVQAYEELFTALPVAIRLPNRIFVSHSLPDAGRLATWTLDQLKKESYHSDDFKMGGCVHSVVWGRDTSESTVKTYLELVGADLLISGHVPTDQGYDTPNPHQVILDGKDENAHVLLFPTKEPLTQEQLVKHLIKLNKAK